MTNDDLFGGFNPSENSWSFAVIPQIGLEKDV
jgi:hypothetical protein